MSDLTALSERVNETFLQAFGRTPLAERVQDVLGQATTLGRFADLAHLRDEAGDLLASVLQLCTECGWDPAGLVDATLRKIDSRREIYARLGRKLRVALLGGAFDPIHNGHLEVATEVLRAGGVDEVWLMPCFDHLAGKSMAPAAHRLEMCQLAARGVRGVGVFDYEIRHEFRGETYHLVKRLLAEEVARVRCDFSLIIGQDNADGFSTWTNADGLERLIPVLVVPRAGCAAPGPSSWYLRPPHRFLEGTRQQFPTSSTEVRNLLRAGDLGVTPLVPHPVLEYIRAHGLYPPPAANAAPPSRRRVAVYSSTFDPPTRFHRSVAEAVLAARFDEVVICPTGPRTGCDQAEHAAPAHRAAMADLGFRGLDRVRVDLTDLDDGQFTPPGGLAARHGAGAEVWHVVGAEQVIGGRDRTSVIHRLWDDGPALWDRARFVVIHPPGDRPAAADRPPNHLLIPVGEHVPSAHVRATVYAGGSGKYALTRAVARYVAAHRLFVPFSPDRAARFTLDRPRVRIVFNPGNPKAAELAAAYRPLEGEPADLILVLGGDGTMLAAVREFWRLRLPFLGINCGHLGFLMNQALPADLAGVEVVTHAMPMLRIDAEGPDGRVARGQVAYSDAWLERATGQAAWLRLEVDGKERVPKLVGDGVLIATPSGSSAYARAMGACPVPLGSPILTLAGSNVFLPHFWQPMALADDVVITLTDLGETGKRPVRGFVDGHPIGEVRRMTVRKSGIAGAELLFTKEFDPSTKLLESLFPPTVGARLSEKASGAA